MKLKILILSIFISPILLNAQNPPACDSVEIDCCTYGSNLGNTINILVSNYSSDIFSYPGFILFTEEMDTVAIETVNYYGIGWSQTHILNIIHPIELPFEGVIELHTGFYDTHVCSFPISIPDSTLTKVIDFEDAEVRVYPNPAHDYLSIPYEKHQGIKLIQIYDLRGQMILEANSIENRINISSLQSGSYFISMMNFQGLA